MKTSALMTSINYYNYFMNLSIAKTFFIILVFVSKLALFVCTQKSPYLYTFRKKICNLIHFKTLVIKSSVVCVVATSSEFVAGSFRISTILSVLPQCQSSVQQVLRESFVELMIERNVNESVGQDLIPAEGYIAIAVVLFFIGFFGFTLNLAVIVFMVKKTQLWTPINAILFNLVLSDFLVSIFGNPWTFLAAVHHNWIFGQRICVMYGFIMSLLGMTSITTLTVLAFERYLMIARPFRNSPLTFRGAALFLMGIWMYALALTVPPLVIGWGEYGTESANISCSVNWEKKSVNVMSYIVFLFTFGLFVPVAMIVFSYSNIILTMKRNALKVGKVTKAERKVAYMILLMIVTFLLAWSPYAILALLIQFGNASFITPGISVLPAILAKSSICYNPIIYIGLNAQFQQIWKQRKREKVVSSCETIGTSKTFLHGMKMIAKKEKLGLNQEQTPMTTL